MRVVAIGLCALLIALSSAESLRGQTQEPKIVPLKKSPFSELFKVPPPTAPGVPTAGPIEFFTGFLGEIRTQPPRVACGIKMIEGDPNVDRKIVIPIPPGGQNAKIRVISPPPCDR